MAYTYSSWEYSQGPNLYIDSSGFKEIKADKTFTYFYIVTYSPVEYKRKVTDDLGKSFYEFKYSFGSSNVDRKVLQEVTFNGKEKVTKTVTHSVTEDGHKDTITKTFYIDTNINSNLNTNVHIEVDPKFSIDITDWKFNASKAITTPADFNGVARGWVTIKETGTRTQSYTSYSSGSYWGAYSPYSLRNRASNSRDVVYYPNGAYTSGKYHYWTYKGDEYRLNLETYDIQEKKHYSYSYTSYYTVSYTYDQAYGTYGSLNLSEVRKKIGDYSDYASVAIRMRSKTKLDKPPKVYLDTSTTKTSSRQTLSCNFSGEIAANELIEFYIPLSAINSTFKDKSSIYVIIEKDACTVRDVYFYEAYTYIELDVDRIPYLNLLVQAYNAAADVWTTACVIPYMNYREIETMRNNKQHISKNLFLPSNLPKTDKNYRIQLDTNMAPKEAEMFTNFRIDVLSKQLIVPGSITDKKLYLNNDTIKNDAKNAEIEVSEIDQLKLNAIGSLKHKSNTHPGFLLKGANDIHAYIRNSTFISEDGVNEANISKNNWYNYITSKNGGWVSNNLFLANTYELPEKIELMKPSANFATDTILSLKVPYNELKPNATYLLKFTINASKDYTIDPNLTVNESSKNNVIKSSFYSESSYDSNKVSIQNVEHVTYSPAYKLKTSNATSFVSEYDSTKKDIPVSIRIETKNIDKNTTGYFTINFNRRVIKNITINRLQCLCIDKDGTKFVDVFEPFTVSETSGREHDINMTIYYDGFHIEQINPLLYNDMVYLREQLDSIRLQYEIEPYAWSDWNEKYNGSELITDKEGHGYGVNRNQPLRAIHFNDVKKCCLNTYEELLKKKPPVILNTSPTIFRDNTGLIPLNDTNVSEGFVLQHFKDKDGNVMEIDKYFPEWRKIIELINRN
jgi:hypothetical protein